MFPRLAQTVGTYEEHRITGELAAWFRCAWRHSIPGGHATAIIVVPDACLDLLWFNGELRVAGPDSKAVMETVPAGMDVLGLWFHPGRAHLWLGAGVGELIDSRIALDDVRGPRAAEISSMLGPDPDLRSFVAAVAVATRCIAPPTRREHLDMHGLYTRIAGGRLDDPAIMARLCTELGQTERTLRRRFVDAFGYGPRTLQRIIRFQRFAELGRGNFGASVAELAAGAGYADQSHLVRESRAMSSLTPARFTEALRF